MKKMNILENQISVSQDHLRLLEEEKWDDWKLLVDKKRYLYRRFGEAENNILDAEEKRLFIELKRLEQESKEMLIEKRNKTKRELAEIKHVRGALKGYAGSVTKGFDRHFGIKC